MSTEVPPGATLGPVKEIDAEGLEVFRGAKHEILHKIWELHRADEVHHLNEVRQLDHMKFFKPVKYRVEEAPFGVNYFGKILLDEEQHYVHARVFRPKEGAGPIKFHSIHTRAGTSGGAVFTAEDEIVYFEY